MSEITTKWVSDLAEANVQIANLKGDVADLRAALEEIADDSNLSVSKGRLSWAAEVARKALAKEGK